MECVTTTQTSRVAAGSTPQTRENVKCRRCTGGSETLNGMNVVE